jgi:hypothetical protein
MSRIREIRFALGEIMCLGVKDISIITELGWYCLQSLWRGFSWFKSDYFGAFLFDFGKHFVL